jgi:hypothetical protein
MRISRTTRYAGFFLGALLLSSNLYAEEGVPPAEWTPQEQKFVGELRVFYQKQGRPLTDEEASIAVKSMRERIARMTGQMAGLRAGMPMALGATGATAAQTASTLPTSGEEEMGARYAQIPARTGDVEIEGRKDGFVVNGRPYLDPEGAITDYAFDVVSGNIGYVVEAPGGQIIKVTRAGASTDALALATARETAAGWQVVTATGKTMAGSTYSVTPNGVLVARSTAAFLYEPGKPIESFALPKGYVLADHQRGDVASTGYVLIERDASQSGQERGLGSLKSLINPFAKKEDFALYGLSSAKIYPLDIPSFAKNVTVGSNCRKVNAVINKCATGTRLESLYQPNGLRNEGHYYWRVMWVNTPGGPLAAALENDLSDLNLIELNTGKKVVGLSRKMGISGFDVKQAADGTVAIAGRLGFKTDEIRDAMAFVKAAGNGGPAGAE